MKFFSRIFLLICLLSVLSAQSNELKINNNGFEQGKSGWTISSKSVVEIDNAVKKDGNSSIKIKQDEYDQSFLISGEISLKVGHIYNLSAFVKTDKAFANPADQYPTSVAACLSMESLPFTNHSQTAGATNDWQKIELTFVATKAKDKIRLHFGYNGNAKGTVWFDNVQLTKIEDITKIIPVETIKWFGKGFRYEERGWIYVHCEGKPYERGYQYGYLVAEEISEMINKLGVDSDSDSPQRGWQNKRFAADVMMLRKYDEEYLNEMKGIADGAAKNGAKVFNRAVDFLDIVTLNSAIDVDYAIGALRNTPHQLTGKSFLAQEDELNIPEKLHKCSAFLANKSATPDGKIVFGQIFMWGGYTGPLWNVICDVVPSEGNRLVYQTFPGGIHSGADFYMNSAGIMIGETTVAQTPLNPEGTPMSNRIRKAAQYAKSIDEVVKIFGTNNNGMYTNDWLIGDVKANEIAIYLPGTKTSKLWRSSKNEFYDNQKDWYWSNNNNKSMEVRKEYIVNPDNAPYDVVFRPANRDIAFYEFYKKNYGKIDQNAGVNLWASSPINRPHACDGKIVTSEMAEQLVFMAHSGKVTLREMFVNENGRIPNLPGAKPRLTTGYTIFSPVFITEKIKELRPAEISAPKEYKADFSEVKDLNTFEKRNLWKGTVFPASGKDNWFNSATTAYYNSLNFAPQGVDKFAQFLKDEFSELNHRYLYLINREGKLKALESKDAYHQYKYYQIPRIKGTYLLHQLRLMLGNDTFTKIMTTTHEKFLQKEITTADFIKTAETVSGKELKNIIMQWLERDDLPEIELKSELIKTETVSKIKLTVKQNNSPYNFTTTVGIFTGGKELVKKINISKAEEVFEFDVKEKPEKLVFNRGNDVLLEFDNFYTWTNYFDEFDKGVVIYGTSQQIEANHTLAQRFAKVLADRFTETIPAVIKDSEICEDKLADKDLIVIGGITDNSLMKTLANKIGLKLGVNQFEWQGKWYNEPNDGLYLTIPNPYNKNRVCYLYISNSALQLYEMTKQSPRLPVWGIFKGDKVIDKGYMPLDRYTVKFN